MQMAIGIPAFLYGLALFTLSSATVTVPDLACALFRYQHTDEPTVFYLDTKTIGRFNQSLSAAAFCPYRDVLSVQGEWHASLL